MAQVEPQYASDYDDRTTVAVRSVLVEIGQILGSYKGKFAVIGGAVPWLLLGEADIPHVGTVDADLSLMNGMVAAARRMARTIWAVRPPRCSGRRRRFPAGTRFLTGSRSLKVLRVPYSGLHGTGGGG